MIILGIETSCDETAAAIIETRREKINLLSNIVSSQIELHAAWGGVVPNLAAREHLKNILPVISEALRTAKKKSSELDLICITNGPGLIPALLIGTTTAKTLSYLWQKPLLGIHHIEGHIYANFLDLTRSGKKIEFPALCLVVSGGHTQLVLMQKHLEYQIIGETLDDAAGEAFDKVARILGLSYPGGPIVSKIADEYAPEKNRFEIKLPRPMLKSNNFNFSFSGIKTAVLYATKKNQEKLADRDFIAEMCREFQTAVCDVLIHKTINAAKKYQPKTILLAGGVSANNHLRGRLSTAISKNLADTTYSIPELAHSLDNAAMIAVAGFYRWKNMPPENKAILNNTWQKLETNANLKLKK
ncbi:MAG: tRNA (adenosine(37)-N6)-threonylcarbamoyltransferase complex transferase subunit TsaD [Candidatus Moraniibacteriota bacterium]